MRPDVALDTRQTSHVSAGMAAYTRALEERLPRLAPDLQVVTFGRGDNFDLAEQFEMPLALARRRPRLAHFPTPFVPRVIPVPYVVTVHDLIDLEFPQFAKRKVAPYWRQLVGPVLRAARAVITDDDATVPLLERYLRVNPHRVRVIPLGVDAPEPFPPAASRARPYFFYAGNARPHKDLATLAHAWQMLDPQYAVDLVFTGPAQSAFDGFSRAGGELVFLGDVPAADVWSLLRGAAAYVHPSLREGFGLPALEALRVGTPAIVTSTSTPAPLRPYVQQFAPGDVAALCGLLARTLRDPISAQEEAERGRVATAALTWDAMVLRTADVYREFVT